MRRIFFALVVFVFLIHPGWAQNDADYDVRVKAAESYIKIISPEKMVDETLERMSKVPETNMTPAEIAEIKSSFDYSQMHKIMLDGLVSTFTADELKALAQFYTSPVGQSISKKMPTFMASTMPAVQQMVLQGVMSNMQKNQGVGSTDEPVQSKSTVTP